MDYELYHDESMAEGYWHGMYLVPQSRKGELLRLLSQARKNTGYQHPISLKNVRRPGPMCDCAKAWLTIAFASLRTQTKKPSVQIYLGRRSDGEFDYFLSRDAYSCRFILFRERDSFQAMGWHPDHASKMETVLRMGLKGGLHLLGAADDPIRIEKIHFDGYEHHKRHLDRSRIVGRITSLREYVEFAERTDLIDDRRSDHTADESQLYDDCQFLQLADLMVGSFRALLSSHGKPLHRDLAFPMKSLITRYSKGIARMQNSRWRNAFCMSQCYIENGEWNFDTLELYGDPGPEQMSMGI